MAEYIEREKLLKDISETVVFTVRKGTPLPTTEMRGANKVIDQIKSAPTADVVKVVRCKDCEYCCISTDPKTNISIQKCGYVGFNPVQSSQVSDDFYCGLGMLKEREGK